MSLWAPSNRLTGWANSWIRACGSPSHQAWASGAEYRRTCLPVGHPHCVEYSAGHIRARKEQDQRLEPKPHKYLGTRASRQSRMSPQTFMWPMVATVMLGHLEIHKRIWGLLKEGAPKQPVCCTPTCTQSAGRTAVSWESSQTLHWLWVGGPMPSSSPHSADTAIGWQSTDALVVADRTL